MGGYKQYVLNMGFSLVDSPTPYEAGLATHDSGGGFFIQDNNHWMLMGINLGARGTQAPYEGSTAISVTNYATWIENTVAVPEPATLSLLGLGGLALLKRRRHRTA